MFDERQKSCSHVTVMWPTKSAISNTNTQVVSCQIGHCHQLNYCLISPGGSQPNWHLFKCYNLALFTRPVSYLIYNLTFPFTLTPRRCVVSYFSFLPIAIVRGQCSGVLVQMVCEYQLCWLLWHYIINTLVIGDLQDWTEMRVLLPVCQGESWLDSSLSAIKQSSLGLIDTINIHLYSVHISHIYISDRNQKCRW